MRPILAEREDLPRTFESETLDLTNPGQASEGRGRIFDDAQLRGRRGGAAEECRSQGAKDK